MLSRHSLQRLFAIAAAVVSVGLPIRIYTALEATGFRGNVHWIFEVTEIVGIISCLVLGRLLRNSDRALSYSISLCGAVAMLLCLVIMLMPEY